MGESVPNQPQASNKTKKHKKHKLPEETTPLEEQTTEEPPPKLRKPQAPVQKSQKKAKKEERDQKEREANLDKYKSKVTAYLQIWKHDKQSWKFNKMTQNWMVTHLYDAELIPESVWSIALEYLAGSKGAAKKNVIDTATKIIESAEDIDESDEKLVTKHSRAKDIIQTIVE